MDFEEEIKELKERLDTLINITKRYYEFWLNGTGLSIIYGSFIKDLDNIKI